MNLEHIPNEIIHHIVSFGGVDVALNLGSVSHFFRQTLLIEKGDEGKAQQKLWKDFVRSYYGTTFVPSGTTSAWYSLFQQLWLKKVTPLCQTSNCKEKLYGIRGQSWRVRHHPLFTREDYPPKYLDRIACNNLMKSDCSLPVKCWKCDKSSWVTFINRDKMSDHVYTHWVYLPSPELDATGWTLTKVAASVQDPSEGYEKYLYDGYAWKKDTTTQATAIQIPGDHRFTGETICPRIRS